MTQVYFNMPPENATPEELEEYRKHTVRMLLRSSVILIVFCILMLIASLFTSCAVQKTENDHTTRITATDTTATESSHTVQVNQQTVNIDSIVKAVWQRTQQEMARQEQEHEITTETLTETIDSLGRIVRQSQKTTDRTLSRQEQQRIERLEQTFEQQISRAIQEHDSVWQDRFAQYQASMTDSLSRIRDLQLQRSAQNPVSWWQQLQMWLGRLVLVALAVLAGLVVIKWKFRIRKEI